MSTTDERGGALAAYMTGDRGYFGAPQVVVTGDGTNSGWSEIVADSGPLPDDHDPDAALTGLGFERLGDWRTVDGVAVCNAHRI